MEGDSPLFDPLALQVDLIQTERRLRDRALEVFEKAEGARSELLDLSAAAWRALGRIRLAAIYSPNLTLLGEIRKARPELGPPERFEEGSPIRASLAELYGLALAFGELLRAERANEAGAAGRLLPRL